MPKVSNLYGKNVVGHTTPKGSNNVSIGHIPTKNDSTTQMFDAVGIGSNDIDKSINVPSLRDEIQL
jgi:hypothetical protein